MTLNYKHEPKKAHVEALINEKMANRFNEALNLDFAYEQKNKN